MRISTKIKTLVVMNESLSRERLGNIALGREPRLDMLELAEKLGAELLTTDALPLVDNGRRAERIACQALTLSRNKLWTSGVLAWQAWRWRHQYQRILLSGEDLALPYAALLRGKKQGAAVSSLAHRLSAPKKAWPLRQLREAISTWIFYSPVQRENAIRSIGLSPAACRLLSFHADTQFYSPEGGSREPDLIVSAGFERRDYKTLFDAVKGQGWRLELGVGSPWSRFRKSLPELPENSANRWRSREELRELYRRASAVVVPLVETDFQAGISVVLEAMACGAPVIVSGTEGLKPLLRSSEALIVPPGDSATLREALDLVRRNPERAAEQGRRAASRLARQLDTNHWVAAVEAAISPDAICNTVRRRRAPQEAL